MRVGFVGIGGDDVASGYARCRLSRRRGRRFLGRRSIIITT